MDQFDKNLLARAQDKATLMFNKQNYVVIQNVTHIELFSLYQFYKYSDLYFYSIFTCSRKTIIYISGKFIRIFVKM